ncbi:STAS domain-containing protein [Actinoplanes sp. M2I2]|uniref:STAS domain-containing protein n=1 Tax=Actinoplanes sp. M2I2 TaxID=1734444 RepID=UPI002021CD43|nr:STAS domain-containing protein [Actinoplanes sp. M2I2]
MSTEPVNSAETAKTVTHPDRLLTITVDSDDNRDVQSMTAAGEIDSLNATHLREAVNDVVRGRRPSRVELDLHGVSFLDSTGIRVLLECHEDARLMNCGFTLVDAHPVAYRVLQISGLTDHFGLSSEQTYANR